MVMVDDCHASGFIGKTGRGSAEHNNAFGKVDITTGTFGKALGGASEVLLQHQRKSLNCCVSDQDLIYFQIHWHLQLLVLLSLC